MPNKLVSWIRTLTRPFVPAAAGDLILFLHIPKCAGTTVIRSLGQLGRQRQIIVSGVEENSKSAAYAHLQQEIRRRPLNPDQLRVIMGHDVFLGMHDVSNRRPWYCTMLREPVQRYVSHYRYLIDCANDPNHRQFEFANANVVENGKLIELDQFVERGRLANVMTNYLAAANHPNRESGRWYVKDRKELVDLASGGLQQMGFIGLVEKMPGDLHTICLHAGVKPVSGIVNPSRANIEFAIGPAILDRIRQLNSLDQQVYERAIKLRNSDTKKTPGSYRVPW